MRKIKVDLQCRVPSWNFCNHDGPTKDQRFSKELCRFCVSTKKGHYCTLHDKWLTSDRDFVNKTAECIDATAGFAITVDEPSPTLSVDPKQISIAAIKEYQKAVADLLKQNYPKSLAEAIALQIVTGDN